MYTCHIDLVDNHILFDHAHMKVLLDTGSPASVGDGQQWEFLGEPVVLRQDFAGWPLDKLRSIGGLDFDILLGMDLVGKHRVKFDLHAGIIVFDPGEPLPGFTTLQTDDVMGIVKVPVGLEGTESEALIDTGAKLSYIPWQLHARQQVTGIQQDFYPGFGRFETDVRPVTIDFAGKQIELVCGILPNALAALLPAGNNVCILGGDLFKQFILEFDFPAHKLTVADNN
jgi:hypothetical protein